MSAWQSVTRQFDLFLHRLRVGHGIPATILPITDKFFSAARDSFEQREQRHITAEAARVAERYAGRDIELVVTRGPGDSAPTRAFGSSSSSRISRRSRSPSHAS